MDLAYNEVWTCVMQKNSYDPEIYSEKKETWKALKCGFSKE